MNTLRFALLAAFAAVLPIEGASAQGISGEIDLLELHTDFDESNLLMDAATELRYDSRGLQLRIVGTGDIGPRVNEVEAEALFLQQVGPSTVLFLGVRHDFRPGGDLTHASFGGTHDLADWLSGETFAYLSEHGDLTGFGELVAAIPMAEGLELEPRAGVLWSAQDVPREGVGAGLTELSVSVRLRQELTENLNAYVGVIHDRLLGNTRELARTAGDSLQATRALIGVGIGF